MSRTTKLGKMTISEANIVDASAQRWTLVVQPSAAGKCSEIQRKPDVGGQTDRQTDNLNCCITFILLLFLCLCG